MPATEWAAAQGAERPACQCPVRSPTVHCPICYLDSASWIGLDGQAWVAGDLDSLEMPVCMHRAWLFQDDRRISKGRQGGQKAEGEPENRRSTTVGSAKLGESRRRRGASPRRWPMGPGAPAVLARGSAGGTQYSTVGDVYAGAACVHRCPRRLRQLSPAGADETRRGTGSSASRCAGD